MQRSGRNPNDERKTNRDNQDSRNYSWQEEESEETGKRRVTLFQLASSGAIVFFLAWLDWQTLSLDREQTECVKHVAPSILSFSVTLSRQGNLHSSLHSSWIVRSLSIWILHELGHTRSLSLEGKHVRTAKTYKFIHNESFHSQGRNLSNLSFKTQSKKLLSSINVFVVPAPKESSFFTNVINISVGSLCQRVNPDQRRSKSYSWVCCGVINTQGFILLHTFAEGNVRRSSTTQKYCLELKNSQNMFPAGITASTMSRWAFSREWFTWDIAVFPSLDDRQSGRVWSITPASGLDSPGIEFRHSWKPCQDKIQPQRTTDKTRKGNTQDDFCSSNFDILQHTSVMDIHEGQVCLHLPSSHVSLLNTHVLRGVKFTGWYLFLWKSSCAINAIDDSLQKDIYTLCLPSQPKVYDLYV